MFKKFIVATDLSDDSLELMGCVGRLTAYGAQKCVLIQYRTVDEVIDYTRGQYPATEINKIAVAEDCSLIVVGARRRTSTGELYFSTLANDLMHAVSKPLMIMRPRRTDISGKDGRVVIDGCEVAQHLLYPTEL